MSGESRNDGSNPPGRLRSRALAVLAGAVAIGLGVSAPTALAASGAPIGPYFSAQFAVKQLPYKFGQASSWANDGQILSAQGDASGLTQIYRAPASGRRQVCLTCRTVKGPNGLPQERAQGDWVLFESYGQQPRHLGAPGLGGYGGDLYVMHRDGSHAYRLTTNSDPNNGAPFTTSSGTPYDNFHAYWSPDGRHIAWTHNEAAPLSRGGEAWTILLGDFTVTHGRPSLRHVRVVGPPYGAYETQPWSPDGKGFLFFAAGGHNSPYQATPPGWANTRVYYMRVYGAGASPARPRVTLISDNAPFYEEQSVFTPDMKTVVMMSNRGDTQHSWYGLVAAAAQRTGYDAPDTGPTQTLQFLADFDGPDFRADLFAVDLRTGAIRRLTYLDYVIPEFFWNRSYTQLLWGMNGGDHRTFTARFAGITSPQRRIPARTPSWLYGSTIDMARVGGQAQPIRDPGPTDNAAVPVAPPVGPAPAFPHAPSSEKPAFPAVTATYLGLWLADLKALGVAADATFTTDPLKRFGIG